jgi:hypothetical protein
MLVRGIIDCHYFFTPQVKDSAVVQIMGASKKTAHSSLLLAFTIDASRGSR